MSAKILEGKFFAQQLKEDAGKRAMALQEKHGRAPGLAVIRVGNDPASEVYVRNKDKACAAFARGDYERRTHRSYRCAEC